METETELSSGVRIILVGAFVFLAGVIMWQAFFVPVGISTAGVLMSKYG